MIVLNIVQQEHLNITWYFDEDKIYVGVHLFKSNLSWNLELGEKVEDKFCNLI